MRFVADSMLGKLARYLRIMGYDTAYQRSYPGQSLSELVKGGRVLLTRSGEKATEYPDAVFIDEDLVKDQLRVVNAHLRLTRDRSKWFSRCIVCNAQLLKPDREEAREHVPDFVFFKYPERIQFCPSCRRFYWPGTHRERMVERLKGWGF